MVLDFYYAKHKLPKKLHLSYLINKTELDNALEEAGVTELESVYLGGWDAKSDRKSEFVIIHVGMLGESRSGYWVKQKPWLSISAVPSELRLKIRELLANDMILQKVAQWLVELELASSVRRDKSQKLLVYYLDGKLMFKEKNN